MESLSIDVAGAEASENFKRCLNLWNTALVAYYDDAVYQASSVALSEGSKDVLRDLFGDAECLEHMCSFIHNRDFERTRDSMRNQIRRFIRLTDLAARGGLLVRRSHHKGDKAGLLAEMRGIRVDADDIIRGIRNEGDAKKMARRFAPLIKRIEELEGVE